MNRFKANQFVKGTGCFAYTQVLSEDISQTDCLWHSGIQESL